MHFPLPKKQLLTIVILIGLLGTQILPINITKGAPKKDHLGLVAILVDENLYTNSTTFAGLSDQYSGLPATTLKARVDRYAEQIQETLPLTKSLIIRTQSNEKPENIKNALQKLYLEGDGSEDAYTQLQGIVLIGNIPLPVVNKNDNRYISMLPYVDFKDPVYLFNQTNTDFEPSPQVNNPEPEIWHGIIRPPSSGEEGNQLLAEYFDKNTLYRQGYSEFTEFEQKLLFADTIAEKKALTDTGVDAYQRFLDHWEENSYHWYTSDLARDLFLEVNGSIEGGDGKDNDGDNLIDEDPLNSYDDDGDGLIDEDDGNQYYGVDNDRDCWAQDPSTQDSNNDGRACYFGDNLVDEDGTDDNNNDNDLLWNEDPIGDLNNDGCSGLCNTDDDGDQADWDGDGWPNGWEIEVLDTKITKRRSPFWQKPSRLPQNEQDILNKMYLDEKYPTYDPLCYTSSKEDLEDPPLPSYYFNGTFKFHPEFKDQNGNLCQDPRCNNNIKNDDDEDGLCEEDTNDDNDKDQDGLVDEDRSGDKNDGGDIFEGLPDIQSKKIIDSFFKKYPELFKKYLADSNLWTDYTGRYQSSYTDDNGNTLSDRETIQGLIGKRDAYVQLFLKAINDLIEESIDKFANKFANDFPLIGEIEISGTIHYKENGETKEGKLEEFTFINHSVENDSGLGKDKIYLNGIPSNEITSVGECSIYRGSFEQGSDAQMVEGLRVFNYQTAGEFNEQGADYGGCYGGFYETPEYCFPEVSQNPIRDQAGTRKVEDPLLSVDYRSCYDFKEKEGLLGGGDNGTSNEKGYWYFADKFIKEYANLSEKLDKGKKDENDDQDQDGDYDQDDFDLEVQNIIKDLNAKGAYDVPVRDPGTIYLFGKKGDIHYLTFGAVLEALGINKNNQIEIGELFSGNQDSITIKGFSFDKDMEVTLNLQKNYITKKLGKLSEDIADALRLPSVLKHVEPIDSTINEQLEAGFSETLPVDRPRHTTFQDTKLNYQRIDYPDVYSVNSWDELVTMFKNEDEHLRQTIPGATNYPSSLTALLGTEIFQEQFSDALQWKNLNIDQKHQWVIENYLNPEAITFVAKPENGYESMYLVANGQADRLNMSFNANAVESDPDLEFNYPDGNYPEEELKPESSASTTTPETPTPTESNSAEQPSWFPFMWMKDIVNWAKALGTTVSYKAGIAGLDTLNKATDQFNTLGLSLSCGSGNINVSIEEQDTDNDGIPDSSDSDPNSIDNNENNIPDGADKTTNLSLEPLLEQILYANGETSALIKIKALDATGNFNNQDNFTHVDLTIIQGEDYVKILSTNGAELINGEATLNVITTTLPGTFILQAVSQKEGNPIYSNNLSLESKTNHLKLSTYLKQTSGQTQNYTTASLEDVLIKNSEDENVAVVHASNGQLEILKPDAYHADALLPTTTPLGIGIYENKTNQQLAFYSITPDNPTITIQNPSTPISGLVNNVKILDANPNDDWIPDFSSSEGSKNNVELKIKDQKIGLLEPNGNIYFKANSDLKLGWGNSYSAINNPHLHLTISKGEIRLFDVIIGTEKENLNIETTPNLSSAKNKPKETFFFNQLKKTINHLLIEKILAATNTFDTDNDRLRDLEELTIGTDLNNPDTDQDTFLDGHELENGYSPLSPNQPLFTDLSKNDESFQDVLSLYLNGIIKGYSDGSFRPNQSITREEFTKLNLGAICLNCTNFPISRQTEINNVYSKNPFPDQDINPNLNYCIAYSKNENLISGYQSEPYASYYLPKNAISRAEATKVLLETSEISTPLTTDSTLPWYTNYIISAQGKTLYPKNRFKELDTYSLAQFDPWLKQELKNNGSIKTWLDSPITRGEFAIMVGNLTKIQNCQNQDQDGDGLNDQTEIYQYETDPKAKDTDQGGVDDYTEIIKKQNPVDDPMDDNTNPGDQKPSNPVPPLVAPANLQTDSDKDGLSDAEEAFYKTDPFNTDSDTGGVNDFEEILKTLDPLNPADDNLSTNNQQSGAYLQGQYLTRATAYQTTENINNSSAETIFYTKEIPADANSKLFLKAEILDETNNIVTQDNSSIIEFIAVDPNAPYAEILRSQVKTTAGIAETEILANSISGYFAVSAQISPIPLPPVDTEVYVYPGQPTSLKINSDSAFLKAGGLNKTKLTIALYDQYGNLANFEPHRLTLTTEGPGNLDSNLDEDPEQIGIQITAYEGVISLDLTSGENEGTVIVLANIDKIESSLKIGVYENIQIQLSLTNESLIADETSLTSITAKAILGNNQEPLIGFNGAVTFGITDPLYGTLSSPLTVPMQDGQASTEFITGAQAGTAYLTANMLGFDPATLALTLLPAQPYSLKIFADSDQITTGDTKKITVKVYDQNNNFVYTDSSTKVDLRTTELGSNFGSTLNSHETITGGSATFTVNSKDLTGPIDLVASSEGLISGTLTLDNTLEISGQDLGNLNPQVLFAALLGGPFGEVTQKNYLAGWFTFKGKTESVLSLLGNPDPHLRLAAIESSGKISVLDSNSVELTLLPANSKRLPTRFELKDAQTNLSLAQGMIIPQKSDFYILTPNQDLTSTIQKEGLYLKPLLENGKYTFQSIRKDVSLLENGNEIIKFQANGQVQILDSNYSLHPNQDLPYFSFDVKKGDLAITKVIWKQNFTENVTHLDTHFKWEDWGILGPGVYFMGEASKTHDFEIAYSGNSTANPNGIFIVDKTQNLASGQKPGLAKKSLESAQNESGIGFDGDNKFMLALADGLSIGEANRLYPSDIGVVLGDPTISLTTIKKNQISSTGFSRGIGHLILSGDETIQDLIPIDYNSDNLTDLFAASENGQITLLENQEAYPRFENKGEILNLSNGLIDMTEGDVNKDKQTDLIVATKDACIKGETCVYLYENHQGNFIRQNLNLNIEDLTIKQLILSDVNKDKYPDLLISDLNGSIVLFYNDHGTFLTSGDLIGNVGLKADQNKNLLSEILIKYPGMPTEDPSDPNDDANYYNLSLPTENGYTQTADQFSIIDPGFPSSGFNPNFINDEIIPLTESNQDSLIYELSQPEINDSQSFIYADLATPFATSTKTVQDLNEGTLENNDVIKYSLQITNSNSQKINDIYLSDVISEKIKLSPDSFTCESEGGNCSSLSLISLPQNNRPFLIKGLSLDTNESITITYSGIITGTNLPTVQLFVSQDLNSTFPKDDYPDIAASPVDNPSGQIIYFYSNGTYQENDLTKINYLKETSTPTTPPTVDPFKDVLGIDLNKDSDEDGTPDSLEGSKNAPPDLADQLYADQTISDDDQDGLANLWDDYFGKVNNPKDLMVNVAKGAVLVDQVSQMVGDTLETIMTQFLCSGGCVASPINYAFLVPGPINQKGILLLPMDMAHVPVFGAPVPGIPPIWPPFPFQGTTAVRVYVSLTLTLGTTISVCAGPYLAAQCWSFAIPLFQMLGVCDAINGAVSDAMSKASSFIEVGKNKIMSLPQKIEPSQINTTGRTESGGLVNYNLGNYLVAADSGGKQRVEGFPKPFAGWLRKQIEEVVNKLTDLPDIYFYYPSPQSIAGAFQLKNPPEIQDADLRGLEKILSTLNEFPLIRIETQKVDLRFPALSADEIEKLKNDGRQWLDDMQNQWDAKKNNWKDPQYKEVVAEINHLMDNVEQNLETLEDYKDFPRQLLKWRQVEAFYIKQIICYLDTIVNNLGGWALKNEKRIELWKKAFLEAKSSFKDWQAIFSLALNYQESCDQCKTARFSLFELLSKLFVFIPEPPLITIPKWPDIVIDLSQIQAGLTIIWPELNFVPEPLQIPSLPRITIPSIPTVNFSLPTLPLLPTLPSLPDLPVLPAIPVPDLPDIPPPPTIPKLPQSISATLNVAKGIMKILCLIQSGIIPVQETMLKTHIEQLTQRPLNPILPLDLSATFQGTPLGINFVDRIEVIAYLNLGLSFDGILKIVEAAANSTNDLITNLVNLTNQEAQDTGSLLHDAVNIPSESANDATDTINSVDVNLDAEQSWNYLPSENQDITEEALTMKNHPLVQGYLSQWNQQINNLEQIAQEQAKIVQETPTEYSLKADQHFVTFTPEEIQSRFTEIQKTYYAGKLTPLTNSPLDELRNELLAYVEKQTTETNNLNINADSFWRQIAYQSQTQKTNSISALLSSSVNDSTTNSIPSPISPFASDLETLNSVKNRYLTQTTTKENQTSDSTDSTTTGTESDIINNGLFIFNEEEQINERLINYTGEADLESHLVSLDQDNDQDEDLVYAYGGNIYLKENFTNNESPKYYKNSPQILNLKDLIPNAPAIDLYQSTGENNSQASISWKATQTKNLGYELMYHENLNNLAEENTPETHFKNLFLSITPRRPTLLSVEGANITTGIITTTEENQSAKITYDQALIEAEEKTPLVLPDLQYANLQIENLEKEASLPENTRQRILVKRSGSIQINPGDLIHALTKSTINLNFATGGTQRLELAKNMILPLSTLYQGDINLRVKQGTVEIIKEELNPETQPIYAGMLLLENERLIFKKPSSLTITYRSDSTEFKATYSSSKDYSWHFINNPQEPKLDLNLENGDYYSKIRTILNNGTKSTWSTPAHLAPQICADNQAPYPNLGSSTQQVSVYKTLTLDGSASFDSNSNIMEYYWDKDLQTDQDQDGDPTNDQDYYRDTNPLIDSNGDRKKANDKDDPILTIGPFDTVMPHTFKLWVADETGNKAGTQLTVNVFAPTIQLNSSSGKKGEISGFINPQESDIPFVLAKKRNGIFELIATPSADENNHYYTDEKGEFSINDLDLNEEWVVEDNTNQPIATINAETGQLTTTSDQYQVVVRSAELPWPTRVALINIKTSQELFYIFLVPDSNVDVQVDSPSVVYNQETITNMVGVHLKDINLPDTLHLESIAANEPLFTGGAMIVDDQDQRWAIIDTDGNIYQLTNLNLKVSDASTVTEQANQENAPPIILTLGTADTAWLEIYIATSKSNSIQFSQTNELNLPTTDPASSLDNNNKDTDNDNLSDLEEIRIGLNPYDPSDAKADADKDGLSNLEENQYHTNPNSSDTDNDNQTDYEEIQQGQDPLVKNSYFEDISYEDPLYQDILDLSTLGILKGYEEPDGIYFKPEQFITRAEFTKILLGILCIQSRSEAFEAPAVFADIPYGPDLPWYYSITKEAFLQEFINGYLGEVNEQGLSPFKPDVTISRAEGAKIILETLEKMKIIDMGTVSTEEPWYLPYLKIAQNLDPYLLTETNGSQENFILTKEEASQATAALTRYDFVKMTLRVLDFTNCFETQDSDQDGLSDYEEVTIYFTDPFEADTDKGGINDGQEISTNNNPLDPRDDDSDQDGLLNSDEVEKFGTDPYKADTDNGGVNDGQEITQGTEPIKTPNDDYPNSSTSPSSLEESILKEDNIIEGLAPGIYIVTLPCLSCPCPTTIINTADILPGDSIFAAIMDASNSQILSISNEIPYAPSL